MKKPTTLTSILWLAAVTVLIGSVSAAFHYRQQAADLQQKLADTAKQAGTQAAPVPTSPPPEPITSTSELTVLPATDDLEEELARLRRKVTTQDSVILSLRQQAQSQAALPEQAKPEDKPEEPNRWHDRGAWMEGLKTSDPEQYAEIMARREEARLRVNDALSSKSNFLSGRDMTGMSQQEQEAYVDMLNLLDETWALADQMNAEGLPWEDRRAARHELRDNMRELGPMLKQERKVELIHLGLSLGYDDEGAREFSRYVNSVVDATSMGDVWRASGRNWRREQQEPRQDAATTQ